jgi:hypothetical protein
MLVEQFRTEVNQFLSQFDATERSFVLDWLFKFLSQDSGSKTPVAVAADFKIDFALSVEETQLILEQILHLQLLASLAPPGSWRAVLNTL